MSGKEAGDTLAADVKAITGYAMANGFTVFPAMPGGTLNGNSMCVFKWDTKSSWKDFIKSAKKHGVSTVVESVRIFTNDDLNTVKTFEEASAERCDADNYDYCQHGTSKSIDYDTLAKNVGKVGFFSILWIDGGCGYSLEEVADWFKPVAAYFVDYKEGGRQNNSASVFANEHYLYQQYLCYPCYCCNNRPELIGLPKALRERTIKDLAKEYADYVKAQAPDLGYGMRTYIRDMFWEEKGVHMNALSKAARFLIKSVEMEASKILEWMEQEQEDERMPEAVEECVQWCKENGISKLTLKALGTFTSTKRIRLSVNNRDILYLKVSARLAPSSIREGSIS